MCSKIQHNIMTLLHISWPKFVLEDEEMEPSQEFVYLYFRIIIHPKVVILTWPLGFRTCRSSNVSISSRIEYQSLCLHNVKFSCMIVNELIWSIRPRTSNKILEFHFRRCFQSLISLSFRYESRSNFVITFSKDKYSSGINLRTKYSILKQKFSGFKQICKK